MATSEVLATGKIAPELLAQLLAQLPTPEAGLIVGPGIGEDAAVLDLGRGQDHWIVVTCDPITFATVEIGHYALQVSVNDLAVTGAIPRYFLPVILLPAGKATAENAGAVFESLVQACTSLDIPIAGGHTEVTDAVTRPVVSGTLLGMVPRDRVVTSSGAHVGDRLLLVGHWPVETIGLIAREKKSELLAMGWQAEEVQKAADYLFEPGICILEPALAAARSGLVTAMHDPTEGGVATAVSELAHASNVGVQVNLDALEVSPLAQRLCQAFDLDPLGAIASGSLLCTVAPTEVTALMDILKGLGWPVQEIGFLTSSTDGLEARRAGEPMPWPQFPADEITKLFA